MSDRWSGNSPVLSPRTASPRAWWECLDLDYRDGILHLAGEDLFILARTLGTPLYAYSAPRVRANLERLHAALRSRRLDYRILYAMKSNRYPPLLTMLRSTGLCGIDACSPVEVARARQVGCPPHQVRDLCLRIPGGADTGGNDRHRAGGLHMHAGCGYLTPELSAWEWALNARLWFLEQCPQVRHVNVGGGLGIPRIAEDQPLDLARWSDSLTRKLRSRGVQVRVEPGDYLVKDAGVLLLQVDTAEIKEGVPFVGMDGGFTLHMEPAFYRLPLEIVSVRLQEPVAAGTNMASAKVAGNINEALDIWAGNVSLPGVREGDHIATLNAGGYGAAPSSDHCMRGCYSECLLG